MEKLRDIGSLIGGVMVTGGARQTRPVFNPATGEPIAHLALAGDMDVDTALEHAADGHKQWRAIGPFERATILKRVAVEMRHHASELAFLLTQEQGKTLREAEGEVLGSAELIDWLAEEGKRIYGRIVMARDDATEQLVVMEPVGPVAALSTWNYPLALAARKVGHALAAGCSVVIKPAEEAPSAVLRFAEICHACGVPVSALQVLFGEPAMVSARLIESTVIRKVSFTGSVPVGQKLAELAGRALKKVTFELGGHAPVIVTNDVDVERAVDMAAAAKFRNAGQICISPTRFIVHDDIYDAFIKRFAWRASALRVGDGARDDTQMGPLTHARRIDAMATLVSDAVDSGARLMAGSSERIRSAGYFWAPTVLSEVANTARIATEEPFGPVAVFQRFADLDEALALANSVDLGLAGYAFTRSIAAARRIRAELEVGVIGVNTFSVTAPEMPFAGTKASGIGAAQGIEGLQEHMNVKSAIQADL